MFDALSISSISILVVIVMSIRLFGRSVLSLFTSASLSFIPLFLDFFTLALVRVSSECAAMRHLQSDISLHEIGISSSSLLPLDNLVPALTQSLTSSPLPTTAADETDPLLLLVPATAPVTALCGGGDWNRQWKTAYGAMQAQYEDVFAAVEKWNCSGGLIGRKDATFVGSSMLWARRWCVSRRNWQKVESQLEWRMLVRCLSYADDATIDRLLYQSANLLAGVNASATPILLNATMQLQLAHRAYTRDLPKSLHHEEDYLTLCWSDVRRCVYCVKAQTLLLSRCKNVNLVFEDVLFVWTLILLSLYQSLLQCEDCASVRRRMQREVKVQNPDVLVLFSVLADYFGLFFHTPKVNLRHFAIPEELKSVVEAFCFCVCFPKE